MTLKPSLMKRLIFAAAIAGCALTTLPKLTLAQSGITIFGGPQNELRYRMDYNGVRARPDRYRLRIPAAKMETAVSEFRVTYPEAYTNYGGQFNPDRIDVRVGGDNLPVEEVIWDRENNRVDIYMVEPVPADTSVELVFSGVRNPRRVGMHFFNALVRAPGDAYPLPRYVGTWVVKID